MEVQSNGSGSAVLAREQAPVGNEKEDEWDGKVRKAGQEAVQEREKARIGEAKCKATSQKQRWS